MTTRIGKPLDLDRLDEDGNLVATTLMEQYYATLAEDLVRRPPPRLPHALE